MAQYVFRVRNVTSQAGNCLYDCLVRAVNYQGGVYVLRSDVADYFERTISDSEVMNMLTDEDKYAVRSTVARAGPLHQNQAHMRLASQTPVRSTDVANHIRTNGTMGFHIVIQLLQQMLDVEIVLCEQPAPVHPCNTPSGITCACCLHTTRYHADATKAHTRAVFLLYYPMRHFDLLQPSGWPRVGNTDFVVNLDQIPDRLWQLLSVSNSTQRRRMCTHCSTRNVSRLMPSHYIR